MIDIILLVIFLLGSLLGYKRGFLRQLFSIISIIIGYVISFLFSSRLAIFLIDFIPIKDNDIFNQFSNSLANLNISTGYHRIIAFVIIFFMVKLIFNIVASSLGLITKLPVVKTVNKLLGAVLGFIEIYIITFIIIYLFYTIPNINYEFTKQLTESTLANLIFEKTPILSDMLLQEFYNYNTK